MIEAQSSLAGLHGVTDFEVPATESSASSFDVSQKKKAASAASERSESHSTTTSVWNVLFGATPRAQVAAFCPVEANACFFVVFEREEEQRGKAGAQMGMSRRAGVAGFWKAPRLLDWPFPLSGKKG